MALIGSGKMLMAIYKGYEGIKVYEWKIKGDKPPPMVIHNVIELVASNMELRYIRAAMKLPIDLDPRVPSSNVRWFGDHARFILANLKGSNNETHE